MVDYQTYDDMLILSFEDYMVKINNDFEILDTIPIVGLYNNGDIYVTGNILGDTIIEGMA